MSRISVVLHRPIYPRNVGMCARAMANMGIERLIVIAPQCRLDEEFAKQGAAHAQDVLRNAVVYSDLGSFQSSEGEGVRIALSGKDGRLKRPDSLDRALEKMSSDPESPFLNPLVPVYLMFGPEDDGLSNEEMELCHHICRLPTYGEITSLNLSHAVLLTGYMVQTSLRACESPATDPTQPATEPLFYPTQTIKRWLEALGFDLSARRVNIEKTLTRILLSRCPTPDELKIIENVLQQTVRKLEETRPKS